MPNQSASSLITSLKQMIIHCRDIQDLLNADKNHFSTNAIDNINLSNKNKAIAIEKLNTLINETYAGVEPHHQSNSVLEIIERNAEALDPTSKHEVNAMLSEFKLEILKAYQGIVTNSKIVSANTQRLKNVWDKIESHRSEIESVYDYKGNTKK